MIYKLYQKIHTTYLNYGEHIYKFTILCINLFIVCYYYQMNMIVSVLLPLKFAFFLLSINLRTFAL
jgi:hypothetical protein